MSRLLSFKIGPYKIALHDKLRIPKRDAVMMFLLTTDVCDHREESTREVLIISGVAAKDKAFLRRMGINYVLNTAEGQRYTQVDTNHLYYRDCPGLRYKGFQLMDMPSTDISKYFQIAANFIEEGLTSGGRVLVHCFMGVSRSATCAIAFLMIKRRMSLTEALATVRARRDIHPNEGFLRQLQQLDRELRVSRVR